MHRRLASRISYKRTWTPREASCKAASLSGEAGTDDVHRFFHRQSIPQRSFGPIDAANATQHARIRTETAAMTVYYWHAYPAPRVPSHSSHASEPRRRDSGGAHAPGTVRREKRSMTPSASSLPTHAIKSPPWQTDSDSPLRTLPQAARRRIGSARKAPITRPPCIVTRLQSRRITVCRRSSAALPRGKSTSASGALFGCAVEKPVRSSSNLLPSTTDPLLSNKHSTRATGEKMDSRHGGARPCSRQGPRPPSKRTARELCLH